VSGNVKRPFYRSLFFGTLIKIIVSKIGGNGMKKIMVRFLLVCSWSVSALYLPQSIRSNKQLQDLTKQRLQYIKQQTQQQSMQKAARLKQESNIPENEILIRGKGMAEGAWINKDIAAQNSGFVKMYLEDWGGKDARPFFDLEIPASKETIESFFTVSNYIAESKIANSKKKDMFGRAINLEKFKFSELVGAADITELIEGVKGNREIILLEIKKRIQQDNRVVFDNVLNNIISTDLFRELIVTPCINMVDSVVMQRLLSKKTIYKGGSSIDTVACQPGGILRAYSLMNTRNKALCLTDGENTWDIGGQKIENIYSVAFTSDGKHLVAGGDHSWKNNNIFVFDVTTKRMLHNYSIPGLIHTVKCIANTDYALCFYTDAKKNYYSMINILTGKVNELPNINLSSTHIFDCSRDGKYIVTGSKGSQGFIIWDIEKFTKTLNTDDIVSSKITNISCYRADRIVISPDNAFIAVSCQKNLLGNITSLMLINISDKNNVKCEEFGKNNVCQELDNYKDHVSALSFDTTGNFILIGFLKDHDDMRLFNISDKKNIQSTLLTCPLRIGTAIFDQLNSNTIIVGGSDKNEAQSTIIDWTLSTRLCEPNFI
jgi:hypothetical protein